MKKFTKILGAAALLLCGLMITGCGVADAIKEQLEGTYDEWYKYNGNTTIDIPLGASDEAEDSAKTYDLKSVEFYVYFNTTTGLKVAVQSTKEQNIELYNGLFSTSTELTMGGVQTYPIETFGVAKWTALIATGYFVQSSEPKISSNPEECIKLDDFDKCKIQWKKVLKQTLLNTLLGE